jgi:hypothetical protein
VSTAHIFVLERLYVGHTYSLSSCLEIGSKCDLFELIAVTVFAELHVATNQYLAAWETLALARADPQLPHKLYKVQNDISVCTAASCSLVYGGISIHNLHTLFSIFSRCCNALWQPVVTSR